MRKVRIKQFCDRGEAALAARWPNWFDLVWERKLNMFSFKRCLLGQIAGHYDDGMLSLRLRPERSADDGRRHGFDTRSPWSQIQLRREWQRRILAARQLDIDLRCLEMPSELKV